MKKILIMAAAAVVLALAIVSLASADAGPHGTGGQGYGITTGACAGCHRAHSAQGEMLIAAESVYDLCVSCHGGGLGSTLDVVNGKQGGVRLAGGGFAFITNGEVQQAVTSKHSVNGSPSIASDSAVLTAWGGTLDGPGINGSSIGLECTSCHNPHGSTNYRILQDAAPGHKQPLSWTDNGVSAGIQGEALPWKKRQVLSMPSGTVVAQDSTSRAYVGDQNANAYGSHTWAPTAAVTGTFYTQGINDFCSSCHKTYLTRHTSGSQPSTSTAAYVDNGDSAYLRYVGMPVYAYPNQDTDGNPANDRAEYRHAVSRHFARASAADVANAVRPEERDPSYVGWPWRDGYAVPLRFSIDGTDPSSPLSSKYGFTCLTCHFAHGTTASANSQYVSQGSFLASKSSLLYYPERGVCGSCHQQGK